MAEDFLTRIQEDIAARLAAGEYFADIPVVMERQGDIAKRVERALGPITAKGGKNGACVIVDQIIAECESPNVSGPMLKAIVICQVIENVTVNQSTNGTGKAALSIAVAVLNTLHFYAPAGLGQILVADSKAIVPAKDPLGLAYDVQFNLMVADPQSPLRVGTPTVSPASGASPQTVTITCGTSDATIIYTTNGNPPYPGQVGSLVYTDPITINGACTLRASAMKPGCITSNTAIGRYT